MMKQNDRERFTLQLKNTESTMLEMFLLAYPLLLIGVDTTFPPHYLMLGLAVLVSILAFVLFQRFSYGIHFTILLSLLMAVPYFFIGLPTPVLVFVMLYAFWRLHSNFGMDRLRRWNYLTINTITFTLFYFITRSYLRPWEAVELNRINIFMFLLTTALFILLRYIIIFLLKSTASDVKMQEINRLFGLIVGAGIASFIVVYYLLEYFRTAIINSAAFLFGGIFMTVSKLITPLIDYVIDHLDALRLERLEELDPPESGFVDFELQDKREFVSGQAVDIGIYVVIALVIVAVIVAFFIARKKRAGIKDTGPQRFSIRSRGRKKVEKKARRPWLYTDASTDEIVRLAYKDFEKQAEEAEKSRFLNETITEWFHRMGWASNEELLFIYEKVRYGGSSLTETERAIFVEGLEKIKEKNFEKKV